MLHILLFSVLTCSESNWIIDGIYNTDLTDSEKVELVSTVLDGTEKGCDIDESTSRRNGN